MRGSPFLNSRSQLATEKFHFCSSQVTVNVGYRLPSFGIVIVVVTPGTVSTIAAIFFTLRFHSRLRASRSNLVHASTAARQPITSSLPTFMARHTAPSHGRSEEHTSELQSPVHLV